MTVSILPTPRKEITFHLQVAFIPHKCQLIFSWKSLYTCDCRHGLIHRRWVDIYNHPTKLLESYPLGESTRLTANNNMPIRRLRKVRKKGRVSNLQAVSVPVVWIQSCSSYQPPSLFVSKNHYTDFTEWTQRMHTSSETNPSGIKVVLVIPCGSGWSNKWLGDNGLSPINPDCAFTSTSNLWLISLEYNSIRQSHMKYPLWLLSWCRVVWNSKRVPGPRLVLASGHRVYWALHVWWNNYYHTLMYNNVETI